MPPGGWLRRGFIIGSPGLHDRRRRRRRREVYPGANAVNEEDPERDRATKV